MLQIKLIDDQATLNNFNYVDSKEYIPNKAFDIKFQIIDSQTQLRLIPGNAATMNVIFQKRDGTELSKAATMLFNPEDKSLWKASLTTTESNDIVGSNFRVDLDFTGGATDLRSGMAYNVIQKITFDGEC